MVCIVGNVFEATDVVSNYDVIASHALSEIIQYLSNASVKPLLSFV